MFVPQNMKNRITIDAAIPLLGAYPQRVERRVWNRYLYTCVHGSIICNSQKVEAAQESLDG
jgi:hypothetical protein